MATTLLKKDYTIIGTSSKNPERVIVEMDKKTLETITSRRRNPQNDISLRDYILSNEIENPTNISKSFESVDALISSMK